MYTVTHIMYASLDQSGSKSARTLPEVSPVAREVSSDLIGKLAAIALATFGPQR